MTVQPGRHLRRPRHDPGDRAVVDATAERDISPVGRPAERPRGIAVGILQREAPHVDALRPPGDVELRACIAGEAERALRRARAGLRGRPLQPPADEGNRWTGQRRRVDLPALAQPVERLLAGLTVGEREVQPTGRGRVVLHTARRGDLGIEQRRPDLVEPQGVAGDIRFAPGERQRCRQLRQGGENLARLHRGLEVEGRGTDEWARQPREAYGRRAGHARDLLQGRPQVIERCEPRVELGERRARRRRWRRAPCGSHRGRCRRTRRSPVSARRCPRAPGRAANRAQCALPRSSRRAETARRDSGRWPGRS